MAVDISDLPVPSDTDISDLPAPPAPAAPTAPVGNFLQNAIHGVPMLYDKLSTGLAQRYASAFEPNISGPLQQRAQTERAYYAPLENTWGAKLGEGVAALPFAMAPGANTLGGAALVGGALGGAQPTTQGESALTNTATGAAMGAVGQKVGSAVGNWVNNRVVQPFLGYTNDAFDNILARSTGSDAQKLTPPALDAAHKQLTSTFRAVRSPNVTTQLGPDSVTTFSGITSGLNPSAQKAFDANPNVTDFLDHLTSGQPVSAQRLGSISTGLRQDASTALNSEGGNREAGLALKALKEHVDDVVGRTIQDPKLAAAYAAARPQYGTLMDAIDHPTLLNASTGRANPKAWGDFLQRNDPMNFSTGRNQSELYQAAHWGQATGQAKGPPPMLRHFGLDYAGYRAMNNPVSGALGGITSRALSPVSPAIAPVTRGLLMGPGTSSASSLWNP